MTSKACQKEDGVAFSRAAGRGYPLAQRDAEGGAKPGVVRGFIDRPP